MMMMMMMLMTKNNHPIITRRSQSRRSPPPLRRSPPPLRRSRSRCISNVATAFLLLLISISTSFITRDNNNNGHGHGHGYYGTIIVVNAQQQQQQHQRQEQEQASSSSSLFTAADQWAIDPNVEIDYYNYKFKYTYTVSNFIGPGQAGFYIYSKECRSGGGSIQTIGFDTSLTIENDGQDITEPSVTDITLLEMSNTVDVPFMVDVNTMTTNPELYYDYGNNMSKIEFCVVFYLNSNNNNDGSSSSNPILEVASSESIVTINIDLSDLDTGLKVESFNVQTKDKYQESEDRIYSTIAYLCNSLDGSDITTATTTTTFTQGDMINLCVKPDQSAIDANIQMGSINSLSYSLMNNDNDGGGGGNTNTNQDAVLDAIVSTNGLSIYNVEDCYGKAYCFVSTILYSTFFTIPGTVSGSGQASLTYYNANNNNNNGRRQRRVLTTTQKEERSLQQQQQNDVDVDVDVDVDTIITTSSFNMNLNVVPANDSPPYYNMGAGIMSSSSSSSSLAAGRGRGEDDLLLLLSNTVSTIMILMTTITTSLIITLQLLL